MAKDPLEERSKQLGEILDRLHAQAQEAESRGNFDAAQVFRNKLNRLAATGRMKGRETPLGKALGRTADRLESFGHGSMYLPQEDVDPNTKSGTDYFSKMKASPTPRSDFPSSTIEDDSIGEEPGNTDYESDSVDDTPFGQPVDETKGESSEADPSRPKPITQTGFENAVNSQNPVGPMPGRENPLATASAAPAPAPDGKSKENGIPGGKAIDPNSLQGRYNSTRDKFKDVAKKSTEARDQLRQLRQQLSIEQISTKIKEAIKERTTKELQRWAKQVIKAAIKQAAMAAARAAAIAINIIVGLLGGWEVGLIAVAILFVALSIYMAVNFYVSGGSGTTPVQATNPIEDQNWITKILALSGDKQITEAFSTKLLDDLEGYLKTMELDASNSGAQDLVNKSLAEIDTYRRTPSPTQGKKIIDAIKALFAFFDKNGTIPTFPGTTRLPLDKITGYNNLLHGRSYLNHNEESGHRTFTQFQQDTCDAVDLQSPDGSNAYPVFDGTVVRVKHDGRNGEVTIQNGEYFARYFHVNPMVSIGEQVHISDNRPIAKLNNLGHIHFELVYGGNPRDNLRSGKCVVSNLSDLAAIGFNEKTHRCSNKPCGYMLWYVIKEKLKLNTSNS